MDFFPTPLPSSIPAYTQDIIMVSFNVLFFTCDNSVCVRKDGDFLLLDNPGEVLCKWLVENVDEAGRPINEERDFKAMILVQSSDVAILTILLLSSNVQLLINNATNVDAQGTFQKCARLLPNLSRILKNHHFLLLNVLVVMCHMLLMKGGMTQTLGNLVLLYLYKINFDISQADSLSSPKSLVNILGKVLELMVDSCSRWTIITQEYCIESFGDLVDINALCKPDIIAYNFDGSKINFIGFKEVLITIKSSSAVIKLYVAWKGVNVLGWRDQAKLGVTLNPRLKDPVSVLAVSDGGV
ncbi:uncharacterized protein LOC144756267 isoform X2 [Lissotriton helveticus]